MDNCKEFFRCKPAPTELAQDIVDFFIQYTLTIGYPKDIFNSEKWVEKITGYLLSDRMKKWIIRLKNISEMPETTSEVKKEANELLLRIEKYEGSFPSVTQMPVEEVATFDFLKNPNTKGTGRLDKKSNMFESLVLISTKQEKEKLNRIYDNAWIEAAQKYDFHPKIAVLQQREGEKNCFEYELIYVRNINVVTTTEQEREKLNESLYVKFNDMTPRPRDYYGCDLSRGDVIVIMNGFNSYYAYLVERVGFTKLPSDFLDDTMSAKIRNNFNIKSEFLLFEKIEEFETRYSLTIMDINTKYRYSRIRENYSDIFALAENRGIIEDMHELGYILMGNFDDFSAWGIYNKTKSYKGSIIQADDSEKYLLFDGWDDLKIFVNDVHFLLENYTAQQLLDRQNGDYSTIEYGIFDDVIEAAIRNSGFYLKGFIVKDNVYMADFLYNGKACQSAVWSQESSYYITIGSRLSGDLVTYEFSPKESTYFEQFKNKQLENEKVYGGNYFDIVQKIGSYETISLVPEEKRVTDWFGDMAMYEIKSGITKEQFDTAYKNSVETE